MAANVQTFQNTNVALASLQQRFGTALWNSYEYLPWTYYSYQQYATAGTNSLTFFANTPGGSTTLQDTNMQTAGMFDGGYFFLVAAVKMDVYLKSRADINTFAGTDASAFASDLLNGFAQAGVLKWYINQTNYLTIPVPFLLAPSAAGYEDVHNRGLVGAAPTITAPPWVTLNDRREGIMLIDPQVLLEPSQSFQFKLEFQRGVVPVIATSIVNDSTNPLEVGVKIDGLVFRPKG